MVLLKDYELEQIQGGAVPVIWIGIAVVSVIIFISGLIDGITNPKECGE